MNAEQRQQLNDNGYVVLERAMGDELLRALRTRILQLFDEEGDRAGHGVKTSCASVRAKPGLVAPPGT